jgi:acid phosphatase family membrane protein YuiD
MKDNDKWHGLNSGLFAITFGFGVMLMADALWSLFKMVYEHVK